MSVKGKQMPGHLREEGRKPASKWHTSLLSKCPLPPPHLLRTHLPHPDFVTSVTDLSETAQICLLPDTAILRTGLRQSSAALPSEERICIVTGSSYLPIFNYAVKLKSLSFLPPQTQSCLSVPWAQPHLHSDAPCPPPRVLPCPSPDQRLLGENRSLPCFPAT